MKRLVKVSVVQFKIGFDLNNNFQQILSFLTQTEKDEVIVFPEGALSGYDADNSFLDRIDLDFLNQCIDHLKYEAVNRCIHIIVGSCFKEEDAWFNAGMYFGPKNEYSLYKKINLAHSERGSFESGDALEIFDIELCDFSFKAAFQLCREIRYPEQWQALANKGAEVFFYLTNAVGDKKIAPIWRSHLVSRAAENQRFICGANAADDGQKCPSVIISPSGNIIEEALSAQAQVLTTIIDLDEVSSWNLDQRRKDVVEVLLK